MARFRNPEGSFDLERRDGRWIQARDERLDDGSTFVTGLDITERKVAESELARYRERLEELVAERTPELEAVRDELLRSERQAAIGELAATLSHELRNPLGIIVNCTELLTQRPASSPHDADAGAPQRLLRAVNRCTRIIDELLSYSAVSAPVLTGVDIDRWLREWLETSTRGEDVDLETDLGSGVRVDVDLRRLDLAVKSIVDAATPSV